MSRARALLVVTIAWAAIYLPGLGTLEIKGEEGRRILPAIAMLQTGDYVVPRVGSDPYFSKPPLVNWLVAASFTFTGQRNEWAARLPSVLCVLMVALAFAIIARASLGADASLGAALIWLTNFGIAEKGRLIEIESLYVSLTGLAFICWLSWWQQRRSIWLTWVVPWIILGLAMLAKGPLHLVFFYAVVLAVLYRAGELRLLLNRAHLTGIGVMLGIFAAWAIPCLLEMRQMDVAGAWTRQFSGRLSGEDFKLTHWLLNMPRALAYFLPWTLLLPFARVAKCRGPQFARGLVEGAAVSFLVISLLPGTLPRYTMPLLVPVIWFTAILFRDGAINLPTRLRLPRVALVVAAIFAFASAVYAMAIMPRLKGREKVRPIAAQINRELPPNESLYALDPDYQPALFYVREPIRYIASLAALPVGARYVLVTREGEAGFRAAADGRRFDELLRLRDYRGKEVILFRGAD